MSAKSKERTEIMGETKQQNHIKKQDGQKALMASGASHNKKESDT